MSYGPGASLGGGLQVCGVGELCLFFDTSDPLSPGDPCKNRNGQGCTSCHCHSASGAKPVSSVGSNGGNGNGSGSEAGGYQTFLDGQQTFPYLPTNGFQPPYVVFDNAGSDSSCCPAAPGTAPNPVPGPGSAYEQQVLVEDNTGGGLINGISVTCTQTGATATSNHSDGGALFYFDSAMTVNYNTPGGPGMLDSSGEAGIWESGSAAGANTLSMELFLNPV